MLGRVRSMYVLSAKVPPVPVLPGGPFGASPSVEASSACLDRSSTIEVKVSTTTPSSPAASRSAFRSAAEGASVNDSTSTGRGELRVVA